MNKTDREAVMALEGSSQVVNDAAHLEEYLHALPNCSDPDDWMEVENQIDLYTGTVTRGLRRVFNRYGPEPYDLLVRLVCREKAEAAQHLGLLP